MSQDGEGTVISVVRDGSVRRIMLARPERRNALSRSLVAALDAAFAEVAADETTRVVVLGGEGPVFCAGGDIAEFSEAAETGTGREDAERLIALLETVAACPVPVVARVQGAAFGGAVGLLCAADLVVAADDARFSLSEARIGLVPAVISRYVLAALGPREAKAKMLLAAPFDAQEALRIGLVHRVAPADELDETVEETVNTLLQCAPGSLAAVKVLTRRLAGADDATARQICVDLLVERLASAEGQAGLRAFLEKRQPPWIAEDGRL
ncbi:MAG TPA: enoyl-CoA hydratase-related protein [Thermomicrobiales bacterium]